MKTPMWASTIDITAEDAATLIRSQFPTLSVDEIRYLGEGWDNKVFLVNSVYVFRFPRREEGVTLIRHEIRVMPFLAPHINLPIAYPRYIGVPSEHFPYPFAGYDYLPGEALADIDFAMLPKTAALSQLAHFLRQLHSINVKDIPTDIPEDIGRMDYEPRVPVILDGLAEIEQAGHELDTAGLMKIVEACASSFPAENTCIVQGDLHPRHILIQDNKISGIIDWGDVSFGCKAMDLSILFTLYPSQYHDAFWAIYGDVPDAVKQQALFRSIYSNVLLGTYALDKNQPSLLRSALQGLGNCLKQSSINS